MKNSTNDVAAYFAEMKKATRNIKTSVDNIPEAKSYVKEMEVVNKYLEKEIPKDFFDGNKEWIERFKVWYAYVRKSICEINEKNEKNDFQSIIRLIESEIPPKPGDVRKDQCFSILAYFANRDGILSNNDCNWIFTCLSLINVLDSLSPNDSAVLQHLNQIIYKNIKTTKKEDNMYASLCINAIIISKYFGQ